MKVIIFPFCLNMVLICMFLFIFGNDECQNGLMIVNAYLTEYYKELNIYEKNK